MKVAAQGGRCSATFDENRGVRKWTKSPQWEKALEVFEYQGDRSFETKPTRNTVRDNGETFEKARQVYIEAMQAGEPRHKLATIAGNAVGLPR